MKRRLQKENRRTAALLRQKDGATIVFALVVFMIAAIICATIVNIAMTNLKRVTSRRSNEQARLAVMSAAKSLESDEADLNAMLDGLKDPEDVGTKWTVKAVNDAANKALMTTIEWKEINPGSSLTAIIASDSGDYSVKARLSREPSGNWRITKLTKE